MNKYLEKIADTLEKDNTKKSIIEGLAGGYLLNKAPERILGYHTLYHGTSKANAEKIMKEGFDPAKGGTGAAGHSGSGSYKETSKGKIHFAKEKKTGKFFAGYTQAGENIPEGTLGKNKTSFTAGVKRMFNPFDRSGKVIKARVSDNAWKEFKPDVDMPGGYTIHKKVGTSNIAGHANSLGVRRFLNKEHLKKYYSVEGNTKRGIKGIGLGLAGAGLVGHAIMRKLNKTKNE